MMSVLPLVYPTGPGSKGLARLAVLLVFLVVRLHVPSVCAAAAEVIRLANGEWVPHTGRDLPGHGCDSRVVEEAFAQEGIRVEYVFLPWARGLLHSEHGLVDGTLEWAGTEAQRRTHFVSRDGLSRQQWVWFYRRDHPVETNNLAALPKATIGVTLGYAYSNVFVDLRRMRPDLFSEASSDLLNFRKLLAGRIDLFPIERAVGWQMLKTQLSAQERATLAQDPEPLAEFIPRLLLSRAVAGNEERMQAFDRGLARLKAGSRYRELIEPCSPRVEGAR